MSWTADSGTTENPGVPTDRASVMFGAYVRYADLRRRCAEVFSEEVSVARVDYFDDPETRRGERPTWDEGAQGQRT